MSQNSSMQFVPVLSNTQVCDVVTLAYEIWTEHYEPIIGVAQTEYMLATYHSKSAIEEQISKQAYCYFLLELQNHAVGYVGYVPKPHELFLSKIYVHKRSRGMGIGKSAMAFVVEQARLLDLDKVTLTVNKNNVGSITAYEKIGFVKTGKICIDIGQGYVMDDITMEFILE